MMLWIQKTFHTDKWWGKTIFIILTYVLYWCTFYASLLFLPNSDYNTEVDTILPFVFVLVFVPILSFFIPYFLKKIFNINKVLLYFLHIFFILLSIILFLFISIGAAVSHIQIG